MKTNVTTENAAFETIHPNTLDGVVGGLECIARGGPGLYQYSVKPVEVLKHGGPGNYPYRELGCPAGTEARP
jgi:hypothetical protein